MRKALAGLAVLCLLALAGCSAADAGTQTDTQKINAKLDKILANEELIKKKLGIVDPVPVPVKPVPAPGPVVPVGPPAPNAGGTAAAAFNWGAPLATASDEFNGTGAPDPSKWTLYNGAGHDGNGRRVAGANVVANGVLTQSGLANGDTGGMASKTDQMGGKWEVRAKVAASGSGHPYHSVFLTWPQSGKWPQGAEYDFFEVDLGDTNATAFMHYPANTVVQKQFQSGKIDLSQWHNYGFKWDTATKTLTGYIDGVQWFNLTDAAAMAPGPMHGTIQLDNFFGSGMQPAQLQVDWYHVWAL